ncbi:MAG: hypothetical protein ACK5X5_09730, partial [bacterium]
AELHHGLEGAWMLGVRATWADVYMRVYMKRSHHAAADEQGSVRSRSSPITGTREPLGPIASVDTPAVAGDLMSGDLPVQAPLAQLVQGDRSVATSLSSCHVRIKVATQ